MLKDTWEVQSNVTQLTVNEIIDKIWVNRGVKNATSFLLTTISLRVPLLNIIVLSAFVNSIYPFFVIYSQKTNRNSSNLHGINPESREKWTK